jgi:hypothetical protein
VVSCRPVSHFCRRDRAIFFRLKFPLTQYIDMITKAERELIERCIQSHLNMIEHHRKAIRELKYKMTDESLIVVEPIEIKIKK